MNKKHIVYFTISFVIIFCVWFAAFARYYSEYLNGMSLRVVLPIALVFSVLKSNLSFKTNKYIYILYVLFALVAFSALYATHMAQAITELRRIFGVILISLIFGLNCKDNKMIPWLYCAYFMIYASIWYYAKKNIIDDIDFGVDRLDDDILNANAVAYYTFYVTFTIFVLGEIIKNSFLKTSMKVLFLLTIPLSVLVAIYTASRQVFAIQVPLIGFLLYFRYFTKVKKYKKVLFILGVVIVSFYAIPLVQSTYEDSLLSVRNEEEYGNDIRIELAKDSFKVGCQHFFTGVGAGNYSTYSFDGHFSHNTYLELFANNGIFGLLIFVYLMVSFIVKQYRRYRETNIKMFLYFFWFGIMYSIDCMFYVMYCRIWLMGFFILVASHSETYYNSLPEDLSTIQHQELEQKAMHKKPNIIRRILSSSNFIN